MTESQINEAWAMRSSLLVFARRVTGSRFAYVAEDAFSEVLTSAIRRDVNPINLKSWLLVAVRQYCWSVIRHDCKQVEFRGDRKSEQSPEISYVEACEVLGHLNSKRVDAALRMIDAGNQCDRRNGIDCPRTTQAEHCRKGYAIRMLKKELAGLKTRKNRSTITSRIANENPAVSCMPFDSRRRPDPSANPNPEH